MSGENIGRTALVTGANRGLGLGVALELARRGFFVVVTARDEKKAEEAARAIAGVGPRPRTLALEVDIASETSVNTMVAELSKRNIGIDVLVNNAAVMRARDEKWPSPAELADSFQTNTLGAYRLVRHLLPTMNSRGYGRVVNVSSGLGALNEMGGGNVGYRLSKTALNAVTRVCHAEASGNVKVNSVCPGWVRTDMGGQQAPRALAEGVSGIVWAATLPDDGPSGGFFRDGVAIEW